MKLSVVIPTHGKRHLLDRTLASLAKQEGAPDFEVVVVDDGADPGLTDHVAAMGLPFDAKVVHHPENRGRSRTRNTGIAHSTGDVVVFLDGDMEVVPGFLAAHAQGHREKRCVVLGDIRTAPEIRHDAFVEYIDSRGVKKVAAGEIPPRYFMTGNSSADAALLRDAGGFDEDFDEYGGEDTEMGYRLAARGGRFRHAAGATSWHLDLNSVTEMAHRLRRYGEAMLPILVAKVPRSRNDLRLDLVEPVNWGEDPPALVLKKAFAYLFCRRPFWRLAAFVGDRLGGGVRVDPLFDFVRAAAYLDGYRDAMRRKRS